MTPRSYKDSSLMVRTSDIWPWLSVHSQIFLNTLWFCATFSDVYAPLEQSAAEILTQKHALAINRDILVSHFGHSASLMWARLILGRFRDAVLPDSHSLSSSGVFFDVVFSEPCRGVFTFLVWGISR